MKRVILLALMAAVILPFPAHGQAKADFSGTWTLDTAKSDPPPQGRGGGGGGGGGGTMTIKQTANELSITSEGRGGPQTLIYKLDGSESTNQVMGRGGAQSVKSTAKWDGANLVIETTRDFQGMAITTKDVRRLDNGGKEMVVDSATQTPNGELKRKTVYTKS
jgi:pectate lyase